ncbi:hypothetical protein Bca52824_026178 [Brassica carinata]|uniref:Uncharacterized protein n=1 Tax=Brassica carinata TaxID=52824 RepID=A0A8X7SJ92_BRACI|nr:hypothetical protein Bca52824_026178 [Brassica carinata]
MVHFYKDNKKVISGKYQDGVYYLQGTIAKSKKNLPRVEKETRKKKSKKVTFSTSLIQGPTPFGYQTKDSSAQGGDSFLTVKTEEIESKTSSEESQTTESSRDDFLFAREVKHKDGDRLAHDLAAPEKLDAEKESKDYEENWDKAGENVDMELGNETEGKVSKILEDGIFGDRIKENATLSKIHTNNQDGLQRKAVPGKELQVHCYSITA